MFYIIIKTIVWYLEAFGSQSNAIRFEDGCWPSRSSSWPLPSGGQDILNAINHKQQYPLADGANQCRHNLPWAKQVSNVLSERGGLN